MAPNQGLVVKRVIDDSLASRAGLAPGDVIRRIDGLAVNDIVDFRYHTSESSFTVEFVRDGMYQSVQMEREWGEELGLEFTFELADQIHTCDNKCVFCFIHQMPKGMRKSLYLMDDDYRLSFLHGNYVTLTNMSETQFERTKAQGLSPLYVSVHATDPKLRGFMLGRGAAEPILPRLTDLVSSGISVHCQVVLCPGLNDGEALDRSIRELSELHWQGRGVLSVAIVPVGLSKYRHNLYPVRPVTTEYAKTFLANIEAWHKKLKSQLGTRFVFPSDEWFFYAERPTPPRAWYEDFPQFEDGVGTCRLFLDEAASGYKHLPAALSKKTNLTLVTGALPGKIIQTFANKLSAMENLEVDVCVVLNEFFGHGITIAGLLTAQDVSRALNLHKPRGIVVIPDITLKDGNLFLDDKTINQLREQTGLDIRVAPSRAKAFLNEWMPANLAYMQ